MRADQATERGDFGGDKHRDLQGRNHQSALPDFASQFKADRV
jgi:hypothetical protein